MYVVSGFLLALYISPQDAALPKPLLPLDTSMGTHTASAMDEALGCNANWTIPQEYEKGFLSGR